MGRDLRRLDDRAALSAQDALCRKPRRRYRLELCHLGIERRAALPLQSAADPKRRARSGDPRRGDTRRARKGRGRRVRQAAAAYPQAGAGRAVSQRPHDPADRQGPAGRDVRLPPGVRRRRRRKRGSGLGGDRRQGHRRTRLGKAQPAAGAARLVYSARLLSGRCRMPRSRITSSACASSTTASRAT